MPNITNPSELESAIEKLASEAIQNTTERVLEIFKKDYILKYAYISSPKQYERTMDFLNAWDWTPLKVEVKRISTEMWYNAGKMSYNIDKFQHGSKYSTPNVVVASLMDILNKKGYSSSLWLSVSRSEAYWDKFIDDVVDGGQLEKILNEEFTKKGFVRI